MTYRLLLLQVLLVVAASCAKKRGTLFILKSPDQTGVTFVNQIEETDSFNILTYEYIYNGGGVGVGDFNNDGLSDLFFTGNQVQNRLYINKGDLEFTDVTDAAGVNVPGRWNSGVTVVDINHDGLMDLFVCATAHPEAANRRDQLFVNEGIDQKGVPHFKEMAESYGINFSGHSVMASFFDYDLDGDLDLYILVNQKLTNVPTNYRPKITDGSSPNNDRLFKNNGDGTFTDVTVESGIVYEGFGLGLAISDFNKDGWPDIYVSNDFLSNDVLYVNQQNGTFRNETKNFITHQSQFSMGNDAADVNNDGLSDLITLDMLPEANDRKKTTIGNKTYLTYLNNEKFGYEYQYVRNMLHLNNGMADGIKFSEVGMLAGVYQTEWSWSPLFVDFDNDGHRDLVVTNGFPKDITDKDFASFRANVGNLASNRMLIDSIPVIKIRNYAYRNDGNLIFKDVTEDWGMDQRSFSNGAAFTDLDNDGDLDYVVSNINDPAFVYENTLYSSNDKKTGNNYLRLKLTGEKKNLKAVGAKITVYYQGGLQYCEQFLQRGFLSSVEAIAHFGLGEVAEVDSVEIIWPDGTRQKEISLAVNQTHSINFKPQGAGKSLPSRRGNLFVDAGPELNLEFLHEEEDQIDFNFQRTLPHKFTQQGPGLAVGDLNGDGREDLILGGAAGKNMTLFLQLADGSFRRDSIDKKNAIDHEDLGLLIFDANGDGKNDLYVATGSFEYPDTGSVYTDRLYFGDGRGNFVLQHQEAGPVSSSNSCVRAADFDRDGDLDLFVGGRVVPMSYPLPASSYILKNDNGVFKDVTSEVCPGLLKAGMVTDALWTDFDGDTQVDLLLVGEFMAPSFFKNSGGKLGLANPDQFKNYCGWWNSIAAADFDLDGDTDYVLGNLGTNNPYNATPEHPLKVLAKDFDGNGSIDPILACYMRESMNVQEKKLFPVHFWDELNSQSPIFRRKFTSYEQYSKVSLDHLFTDKELEGALELQANDFRSVFLQNEGGGNFIVKALPVEAQIAPIFGILALDVNGDTFPDLVAVGNDFGQEVFIGRYDAFTGLVLLGNGKGDFISKTSSETAFYVPGDAKGLVSLIDNGRAILVAAQNQDSLRAFIAPTISESEVFSPDKNDLFAEVEFLNGSRQRIEFYHGVGYLSQPTRRIPVHRDVRTVKVFDFSGKARVVKGSESGPF